MSWGPSVPSGEELQTSVRESKIEGQMGSQVYSAGLCLNCRMSETVGLDLRAKGWRRDGREIDLGIF